MTIRALITLLLTTAFATSGCTSSVEGPTVLELDAADYRAMFEAATDAVRHEGLSPELRDLRGGVIETAEAPVPSMLEPWRFDGSDFEHRWEATLARERRRARIAFTPAQTVDRTADAAPGEVEPRVAAVLDPADIDLTTSTVPLEMRVWVYVERAHRPGVRRGLWSRRLTSRYVIVPPDGVDPLPNSTWTPISRDHDFERRLLARIEASLSKAPPETVDGVRGTD